MRMTGVVVPFVDVSPLSAGRFAAGAPRPEAHRV